MQTDTSIVREKITLYRIDYPDTIEVSRELANRLIKESAEIWIDKKDEKITLYRIGYPDTIEVSVELANRLIKESGGIWKGIEINKE